MAEIVNYRLSHDLGHFINGIVIDPPKYTDVYLLEANEAQNISIPDYANIAIFNSTNNFWVSFQGIDAVIPTANITDGTAPELNPVARDISNITNFSMISDSNCLVIISYFRNR